MALTLIITGMHRSGTSLTAAFVKAIGVDVGNDFFPADKHNLKGYFEDVDFLEFQRGVLRECCRRSEAGLPDWGWTESGFLDRKKFDRYIKSAKELIEVRDGKANVWGWKDPRTSLMLDFWDRLLPEAKYLFVYRFPWDVANSIQRIKAEVFQEHPDYALKSWAYYNRHLLNFYQKNVDRCLLFNVNAWIKEPNKMVELLKNKLNLEVENICDAGEFKQLYDEQIFNSLDWQDHQVKFLQYSHPEYFSLLAELDRIADIPSELVKEDPPQSPRCGGKVREEFDVAFSSGEKDLERSEKENIIKDRVTIAPRKMKTQEQYEPEEIAISVIIPCYDQGEYILEAISSVEACQERQYEILIVNDCSTEKLTIKVLDYLRDNGYQIINHQNNQGLAEARNTGVSKARGRYILPLDSDNKIRPEYITRSIEILDKYPKIGVVYGNPEYFGEKTGVWQVPEFNINKIAARNYIDACAVYRKQVWDDCGGYDPKIPDKLGYEDWDFWLGAVEKGWQFHHISEVLFDYRVRYDSMVSACRIPENHARLVHYICSKHLGIYTTNFASILAEKDAALLIEESRYQRMEMELQKTQAAFAESQEQLERIQSAWSESQSEIQCIQSYWEEAQQEVQRIQTAWEEAQSKLQISHDVGEKTQAELRRIQTAWDDSQSEIQRIQTAWENSQTQLQETHAAWREAQQEAQQIHAAWEKSQDELRLTHAAWEESQHLEQQEVQRIHAAWEEAQQEAQRIQSAWEEAQQQLQLTQAEWEKTQQQLQLTHAEWQKAGEEVQRIRAAWEEAQQQLQLTHTEWARSQQQLQLTHAEWARSQQQLQQAQEQLQLTHDEWEKAQEQLRPIQAAWEEAQQQVQQIHAVWTQTQQQMQVEREQSRSQLQQIYGEWEKTQQQLEQARSHIQQMQSSKFWKLKTVFFRFKQSIGLANKD